MDVEPVHTFRGHRYNPFSIAAKVNIKMISLLLILLLLLLLFPRTHRGSVLSVAVGASGEICFSGSTDTTIRVWQLPSDLGDPFDVYGTLVSCLCAPSLVN